MKLNISLILVGMLLGSILTNILPHSYQKQDQTDQTTDDLYLLQEKISDMNDSLQHLIERSNSNESTIQLTSINNKKEATTSDLRKILEQVIDEKLSKNNAPKTLTQTDIDSIPDVIAQLQTGMINGKIITSEYFSSNDLQALSPAGQEQVISELVGMMNRGEIDADMFFGITTPNSQQY